MYRYDLHTHSTASDGTLAPAGLVRRAAAAGIDCLALTDHDTVDGIAEAAVAADRCGIRLQPGVEISVTWERQTIHVVGLGVDPGARTLRAGLARLQDFRRWRAEEIGRRLERIGVADACAGARALAAGPIVGRTHFARLLVQRGRARSVREVFQHFLVRGKPGHVPGEWATLEEAVAWIRAAGGQAVIAHPARYRLSSGRLRRLIGEFRECGGEALEVVSGSHGRDAVAAMAGVARREGMLASAGSDYHGPGSPWIELGRLPPLPAGCTPVWARWSPAGAVDEPARAVPA